MRHSHESLCEVSRGLAALAQPACFGNRYFRKAVGLFFLVVNYITCSDDVEKDILSFAN